MSRQCMFKTSSLSGEQFGILPFASRRSVLQVLFALHPLAHINVVFRQPALLLICVPDSSLRPSQAVGRAVLWRPYHACYRFACRAIDVKDSHTSDCRHPDNYEALPFRLGSRPALVPMQSDEQAALSHSNRIGHSRLAIAVLSISNNRIVRRMYQLLTKTGRFVSGSGYTEYRTRRYLALSQSPAVSAARGLFVAIHYTSFAVQP